MSNDQSPAFDLRVVPEGDRSYRLALWQRSVSPNGSNHTSSAVATLRGVPLQVAMGQVLEFLKREGHRASALGPGRKEPLTLGEESGVRLGLLFLALRPLVKVDRMEAIAEGLRAMPSEEAYYWFSKCRSQRHGLHAQRALRILLAGK